MRASALGQKSLSDIGRWEHAGVLAAEETVAIAGEDAVCPIANERRDDDKCVAERPNAAERFCDPQPGGRVCERSVVLDQYYRIDIFADAVFVFEFRADLGLKRCEFETFLVIVFDNKIDGTVAKITDAIKKYDRTHR